MADRKRVIEALRSAADNEIERLNAAWNECSADKHRLLKEVRALDAEVARLQARERELDVLVRALLDHLWTDAQATSGYQMRLMRTLGDVLDSKPLAAVSAETPDGHTRMTDGITPSEPTEWLQDLAAVSTEKEGNSE